MKEKDKENDQTYGLNGIRRTVGEKPLLVLQEFNETTYPSKAQTEYMVRTAHVHSEFVTVPFVSRLTDKPANAEAAIDRYLEYIGSTLDVIETYNRKPIMAAVPLRLPFTRLADVVNLYCNRDVRAFCLDFAGATPETGVQGLEQVLYALASRKVLEESFVHGINVSPGRPRTVTPVASCRSILAFGYGADGFGDLHRTRVKMELQPKRKPVPPRLFSRQDYGDHLITNSAGLRAIKPDKTAVPLSRAIWNKDLARLFNAEQHSLEAVSVPSILHGKKGIESYLQRKKYVEKSDLRNMRTLGAKLGRRSRQKKITERYNSR